MFEFTFMRYALLGVLLISPMMGMLGTMAVNNKMAFFSDALGHSALTGIALGVLLGIHNELLSMVAFGIFMALVITRVKGARSASTDTIISVFSSAAIAFGLVILSMNGEFSSYSRYLIGDILSISRSQLILLAVTLAVVVIVWALLYNKLMLAASRGVRTALVENIFVVMVAVVVMLSIQWVGILLINSLLILPAAAARNIARSSRSYLWLSVGIATACGVAGLMVSYAVNTSAGATIVLICAIVFMITYFCRRRK